jgi:putative inorganic carbon (HCO3(-)) transporter
LGLFSLARLRNPIHFLWPICGGFLVVIAVGIQQHFGGLEESRQYFFAYIYPQTLSVPPEFLKKISSDRIFSTQFYPNALAGVVLLLLPATLVVIWQSKRWLTAAARAFLIGVVGLAALACLYWSGSKGGWLLMLVIGMAALLRLKFSTRLKVVLVGVVLMAGLGGFALKYAGFFQRGATSVSARFDYWNAALRTTAANPLFGTGPGTFAIPYKQIKRPESEMARLTHNDYLQQASDSGLVGFAFYVVFIVGALFFGKPSSGDAESDQDLLRFSIWLGLLGWSLQSLLEFGLYIPALAWYGFACLGLLVVRTAKPIDKPQSAEYSASHK